MTERFALGDFSGCLRAAELLLGQDRGHDLAAHYARESREKLEELYTSRLTAKGRIPVLAVLESDVRWLGLDPRVGFLISRIDGRESSYSRSSRVWMTCSKRTPSLSTIITFTARF